MQKTARHHEEVKNNTEIRTTHVEPSGVQALKNPKPFEGVEALAVLDVAVLV